MSLALPRLACCAANAHAFAQLHTPTGSSPSSCFCRGGPDNKKASIAGSSKFKLAEEEGFEPS